MNQDITKAVVPLKRETTRVETKAQALEIKTDEDLAEAAVELEAIRTVGKRITAEKEKFTKPANEIIKSARALFGPLEAVVDEANRVIRSKMVAFQAKREAAADKKEVKIEAQFQAGKITSDKAIEKLDAVRVDTTVAAKNSVVKFKTIKDIEIVDQAQVPDEYWVLDMPRVRKAALAGLPIPGVKVVEKKITSF